MKVKNVTNIVDFFDAVQKCEGNVVLVTQSGDRLCLKSTLSQCISIVRFFSGEYNSEMEIVIDNANDNSKLFHYLVS